MLPFVALMSMLFTLDLYIWSKVSLKLRFPLRPVHVSIVLFLLCPDRYILDQSYPDIKVLLYEVKNM